MNKNFKTPVSMEVTPEQFKKDLKEPLLKLGYYDKTLGQCKILVNNECGHKGILNNYSSDTIKTDYNRHFIKEYNVELFLALAAMTEGEDWIIGEYLVFKKKNKIFKCLDLTSCKYELGKADNKYKDLYRKATVEELINHFSKGVETQSQIEIISEQKIIGYICPTDLWKGKIAAGTLYNFKTTESSEAYPIHYTKSTHGVPREIVQTWEKRYEENFKTGDWVTILEGNHKDETYRIDGQHFINKDLDLSNDIIDVLNGRRIIIDSNKVRKATTSEIENGKKYLFNMGNFLLEIKNGKCFHKSEDISQYVIDIFNWYKNIPTKLGKYDFLFKKEDIIINKSGCEANDTKIVHWLAVHKIMILSQN